MPTLLAPELLWLDGRFQAGMELEIDDEGVITRVAPLAAARGERSGAHDVVELPGRALLPGFVNAHSHAFQRLIRGRTQWRPAGAESSDFWSWREAMYGAALSLAPEDLEVVSRFCFIEMLRAGITSVGEFHYLQRDERGQPYADPNELAGRVIEAARAAGIRIALLNVCYVTSDIDQPLRAEQRRFATPSLEGFLEATSRLADRHAADPLVSVGIAPHSIRAVPQGWLAGLAGWAGGRGEVIHMHVSEQTREVDACRAAHGLRPLELLEEEGVLGATFTAVHATHLVEGEARALAAAGATVCACPTTERDLGDGFLPVELLVPAGVPIALGTDSNTVIDMLEEARSVEYHERLRRRRRAVVTAEEAGGRLEVAPPLLAMATAAGARSLGLPAGAIEPGRVADLAGVDLGHRALAGWDAAALPALLALSAPADAVRDVWVGGRRVVEDGFHPGEEEAARAFAEVARRA